MDEMRFANKSVPSAMLTYEQQASIDADPEASTVGEPRAVGDN
jgi:hypothetical protein